MIYTEPSQALYLQIYDKQDNLKRCESVKSVLISGDPDKIPAPYLSFVIPTYRREKLLEETLRSILVQPEAVPFEIVVVDNSADFSPENNTRRLIERLACPKLLYYINKANLGQAGNWNRCIELARGGFVSMIHDDDLIAPDYLPLMLDCLRTASSLPVPLGAIKASFLKFCDPGRLPERHNRQRGGIRRFYKQTALRVTGIGPTSQPSCGTIFNREAVLRLGGFNPDYTPSHDYMLGYKLLVNGLAVYSTEDMMGYYRIGENAFRNKEDFVFFCKCDYYFREALYAENLLTSFFGSIFRNTQYSFSIDNFCKTARDVGIPIEKEAFFFQPGYGPHRILRFLFKVQRKLFTLRTNCVVLNHKTNRKSKK